MVKIDLNKKVKDPLIKKILGVFVLLVVLFSIITIIRISNGKPVDIFGWEFNKPDGKKNSIINTKINFSGDVSGENIVIGDQTINNYHEKEEAQNVIRPYLEIGSVNFSIFDGTITNAYTICANEAGLKEANIAIFNIIRLKGGELRFLPRAARFHIKELPVSECIIFTDIFDTGSEKIYEKSSKFYYYLKGNFRDKNGIKYRTNELFSFSFPYKGLLELSDKEEGLIKEFYSKNEVD